MIYDTNRALLFVIIGLGVGLFYLDLYLPSGISTGVLYGGLVILSFLLPYRKGPLIAAAVCSVLDLAGTDLGQSIEGVPHWMGVVNRLFSLTAIWLPLLFFLHRRKAEDELRQAHDELEARVQARTQQLAALNQSLIIEIADRMETEQSLRASEAALQARERQLQQNREELRALAGQLLTAQEEDRRRISRDLHDHINQRLAMLSMDLRQIEKGIFTDHDHLRDEIRRVSECLILISDDVRQMAYRFHPSILDDLGLIKAVRGLVDDFSTHTGIQSTYVHNDPVTALPDEVTICIYRIVQESLSNVARHAQASQVEVEVMCDDETIDLSIRDNGVGFDLKQSDKLGGHLGLLSMKERVRLAQGTLEVESTPGHGTHIRVAIPLTQGGEHV
ncbi:MAG: sensor histidine kinase [Nitrospira sp. LK70]|nr:sensor histidine kinase [Nitrospira sp. LK70]